MSDRVAQFKIYPLIGKGGIGYIIKENKIWGKYLRRLNSSNFSYTDKYNATKWSGYGAIMKDLREVFGNDFTIVDNYL